MKLNEYFESNGIEIGVRLLSFFFTFWKDDETSAHQLQWLVSFAALT